TVFAPPPLARLAILPFDVTGAGRDSESITSLRGGLSDVAARLGALGAATQRLVIIKPDEVQSYHVDSAGLAATRLRATHALSGEFEAHDDVISIHATLTELDSGSILQRFDGTFRPQELASVSTSLAAVVTSAFHLRRAPPA